MSNSDCERVLDIFELAGFAVQRETGWTLEKLRVHLAKLASEIKYGQCAPMVRIVDWNTIFSHLRCEWVLGEESK